MVPTMRRPLGSFETAAVLTHRHAPFTVVAVVELEGAPPPERLRRALDALQAGHPLLAVRVAERGGRFWFDTDGVPPIPLELAGRGGEGSWVAVAEDELGRRVDEAVGPLVRCKLLVSPGGTGGRRGGSGESGGADAGGRAELALTFHHAVMDATSAGPLLAELLALWAAAPAAAAAVSRSLPDDPGTGHPTRPAASSPPAALPPPSEALFPAAHRGARGLARRLGFLGRQLAAEAALRLPWRRGGHPPAAEPVRCRVLPVELPEPATAALVRAARRRRVTVNGALGAALLLAVHRRLYGGREVTLRHIAFADLRPFLAPPVPAERLGAHLAMLPLTARLGSGTGFWSLARELTLRLDRAAARGEKFSSTRLCEMIVRSTLRRGTERMAATAVSFTGAAPLGTAGRPWVPESRRRPAPAAPAVRGVHAFVSSFGMGPELSAQARLSDGRLRLDAVYLGADMDDELAREVAAEVLGILRSAAEEG